MTRRQKTDRTKYVVRRCTAALPPRFRHGVLRVAASGTCSKSSSKSSSESSDRGIKHKATPVVQKYKVGVSVPSALPMLRTSDKPHCLQLAHRLCAAHDGFLSSKPSRPRHWHGTFGSDHVRWSTKQGKIETQGENRKRRLKKKV